MSAGDVDLDAVLPQTVPEADEGVAPERDSPQDERVGVHVWAAAQSQLGVLLGPISRS